MPSFYFEDHTLLKKEKSSEMYFLGLSFSCSDRKHKKSKKSHHKEMKEKKTHKHKKESHHHSKK